ncbi:MAG: cytochrome c peroxidase [Gammaproteobacteria bacterium]
MKVLITVTLLAYFGTASRAPAVSHPEQIPLAPGYGKLLYEAPAPGSYELAKLGPASDGKVIDSNGKPLRLHEMMGDKIVLLSFIYSTCDDVNGCPLATSVLHRIKTRLQKQPQLAAQLRLLTLSFNPEHDTPAVMQRFGADFQGPGVDWRFLTTASDNDLQPIMQSYKQTMQKQYDADGKFTGTYAHILRVFLIDREKQIRNIYSVSFLHPELLLNDIKTLLQAEPTNAAVTHEAADSSAAASSARYRIGDNKQGYGQKDYRTRSIALSDRKGESADLLYWIKNPPLGLPPVPQPQDNPATAEKIRLGRKLFYDRRLSLNNTFSCAMCHVPEQGFTSNEMATAVGIEGRSVRRNSPTLYNVGYLHSLFHDGRETTLEQQVWGPLLARNEMGNPSVGAVIEKIRADQDYAGLFEQAFKRGPSMETVGMAIAAYERTLNSANSPFDRWYYGKRKDALSASAQRGFKLFNGKARCASCHTVTDRYALFTDQQLHNTGIGYAESMGKSLAKETVQVAPGQFIEVDNTIIAGVSGTKENDLGRYEITQRPEDRWKYKTPTLRNIALTAPYMHNGVFGTLKQVVEFYNQGGIGNENLDPSIQPLHLTEQEKDDLAAFLQGLTGSNVETLVSDAFAAPVGDMR